MTEQPDFIEDQIAHENDLDAEALMGAWRWLVIAKRKISAGKFDGGKVVYVNYSDNTDRWIAIVDFVGGGVKLIDALDLGPELPDRPFPWGLAYPDPTSDIDRRLTKSEESIADEIRALMA